MEKDEVIESPRKRLKTDNASLQETIVASEPAAASVPPTQGIKEAEVGILEFVSTDVPGFEGILKRRWVRLFFFNLTQRLTGIIQIHRLLSQRDSPIG